MTLKIFHSAALLSDREALERLLLPVANSERLRSELKPGVSVSAVGYDAETRTSRHIVSDGTVVLCCSVLGVGLEQAAEIAAHCEAIESWSAEAFKAAVEGALGAGFARIQ